MTSSHTPLGQYDWQQITQDLNAEGWALLPGLFSPAAARELALPANARQALSMLETLRHALYPHLLPLARVWAAQMQSEQNPERQPEQQPNQKSELKPEPQANQQSELWSGQQSAPPSDLQPTQHFPDDCAAWLQQNHAAGQTRPLSALHRHRKDEYQALTHHADGDVFPLQLIALLSDPGRDFTGGEFVMTEQRPRMQSRPMVLPLRLGDAAVIAVSQRPVQGARDIYRVTARHAISRVRSGERVGLEVLLHDGR